MVWTRTIPLLASCLTIAFCSSVAAKHHADDSAFFVFWDELLNDLPRYEHVRLRVENVRCYGTLLVGFTCISPDGSAAIHARDVVLHEDADRIEALCPTLRSLADNVACVVTIEFEFDERPPGSGPSTIRHLNAEFIDVMLPP